MEGDATDSTFSKALEHVGWIQVPLQKKYMTLLFYQKNEVLQRKQQQVKMSMYAL
jgi:hypothetical protein